MSRTVLLIGLMLIDVGCRDSFPISPTAVGPDVVNTAQDPPGSGPFTMSGLVFEAESDGKRPLPGLEIGVAVETSPGPGIFFYYQHGKVSTNEHGQYHIAGLPPGRIWIFGGLNPAARGGDANAHVQPCAAAVQVETNTTFDLELVSPTNPPPRHVIQPLTISGTVFELTPGGRVALSGARVFAEKLVDVVATGSVSDALGRYALCGLPQDTWQVFAVKDGYQTWVGGASWLSASSTLDIELKRK